MTDPSIKSAEQCAAASNMINYPGLDAQAQELHDCLMAELDASAPAFAANNNSLPSAAFTSATDTGLGIYPALLKT